VVTLRKDDKTKNVGVVKINLADYLDKSQGLVVQKFPLDKCPDKQANIQFTLKSTLLAGGNGSETASMMSCDIENDSGPESEFNFEDMDKDEKPARQRASSAARASIGAI
jgi:hypothetical protein